MDPLEFAPKVRWRFWIASLMYQIPLYLVIWAVTFSLLDMLRDPTPRTFLVDRSTAALPGGLTAFLGNPTAYLALIGAVTTIFFTFRQIRAKVRADSRQQWILQARRLIGEVVALVDHHKDLRAASRFIKSEEVWVQLNPLRLELELMLNPSEKDHRLLLYLIQRFANWRQPRVRTQDAQILFEAVMEKPGLENLTAEPLPEKWKPIIEAEERGQLVSYILRLSHVILKREWERVKHTR